MNITFHVVEGAKSGRFTLSTPVKIGRGRSTKLTLPLPLISREHCEVFEQQGSAWIRDLGSTNGTIVADQKIAAPTPLDSGQVIKVGSVTLRVEFDMAHDAASTPTADFSASLEPLDDPPPTVDFIRGPETDNDPTPVPIDPNVDPMAPAVDPSASAPPQQPPGQAPGPIPMAMPIQPAQPTEPPAQPTEPEAGDDELNDFLDGLK